MALPYNQRPGEQVPIPAIGDPVDNLPADAFTWAADEVRYASFVAQSEAVCYAENMKTGKKWRVS